MSDDLNGDDVELVDPPQGSTVIPDDTTVNGDDVELAQVAYAAYGASTGYKNFMGDPMPEWVDLGDAIRGAWLAAVREVRDRVKQSSESEVDDGEDHL